MQSREQAESAAAAWIARRESDCWSDADQAALEEWLASSLDNRVAWLRLNAAWQATDRLKTLHTRAPAGTVPEPDEVRLPFSARHRCEQSPEFLDHADRASPASNSRRVRLRALAASVLLICAAMATWKLFPSGPAYETDIGAVEAVPLPDGSRVTLNTNTRIKVDLTQSERRINLARGEAYFEVAKDPARPFVVHAGDKRVVAVGTRFSVREEVDGVRVFVTDGIVRVEQSDPGDAAHSIAQLQPGAIAHAVGDGVVVQTRPVAEVEQLLTWRSGYLVFDRTPLADAIAEFNRYNRRKIIITDPRIAAIRIGGNFRATNLGAFLRLIESDFPIVASDEGDRIILAGMSSPGK